MTALALTSELDALNTMLDAIGAAPVNSLTDPSVDVSKATSTLSNVAREVQSRGWHWNVDERYPLARTTAGEYPVPLNVLRIDVSDDFGYRNLVQRGTRMWDRDKHTFIFTDDLTFNVVWLFPFDELPEAARNYVTIRAACRFQERVLGSDKLARFQEQDEQDALAALLEAEMDTADYNILTDTPSIRRSLGRSPENALGDGGWL